MVEYIEKQATIDNIEKSFDKETILNRFVRKIAISAVRRMEPADVRHVVRGRWKVHCDDIWPTESTQECSECHEEVSLLIDCKFCPNCGADMREDANSLSEALKRNTTKIVEKANGIYAECIRHLQEKNKALDEELASLLNEADAGLRGGDTE